MNIVDRAEGLAEKGELPKRTIFARQGKFGNEVPYEYIKISLVNNKSINLEEEQFTNFLSANEGDKDEKKALTKIKEQIIQSNINDDMFEIMELKEVPKETSRILRIVNSYGSGSISNIIDLLKCKYRYTPTVQLYVKNNNKVFEIYLVDVHHLGLPGDYFKNGKRIKYNIEKLYDKHKNKTECLSVYLT